MNITPLLKSLADTREPWVRLNTLRYLPGIKEKDPEYLSAFDECISHPLVQRVLHTASQWPEPALKSHKAASHPMHHLPLLADLGLDISNPVVNTIARHIRAHQDADGALQSIVTLPSMWGGSNKPEWLWMFCDAPLLLHACLSLGVNENDPTLQKAVAHLTGAVADKQWTCFSSLEKLKGPGRKNDPCPYATLLALKAFALLKKRPDAALLHQGTEIILSHWERQKEIKLRMFGIGTDFRKLKYPFVFYDILHVTEVLSHFPWVWKDSRFTEMINCVEAKRDSDGFFTPESVWMAFKGFDFAQKKAPSPMLTFVIERMLGRRYN